jgi:hypothetical protein
MLSFATRAVLFIMEGYGKNHRLQVMRGEYIKSIITIFIEWSEKIGLRQDQKNRNRNRNKNKFISLIYEDKTLLN